MSDKISIMDIDDHALKTVAATMELRFISRMRWDGQSNEKILQQKWRVEWVGYGGQIDEEWRDVPLVKENDL